MEEKNIHKKKKINPTIAVTHHIRNPSYVLKGYIDAIFSEEVGEINDKQRQYLSTSLKNIEKINHIIERLIYTIEIEEGFYDLNKDEINIIKIIKNILEENASIFRATNNDVYLNSKDTILNVIGDEEKIKEVLLSLLFNSIKYKEAGEGKINIFIGEEEESVFCKIEDNGIGVLEEEKNKIFKKFYRGKKAIEIDPSGLGLELYVTKKIINDWGGNIWVESNENNGASFIFTIPATKNKSY